ncbi:MAG: histidine phosphatase family protein, partial [Chloroflexi bacterium]
MRIYLARHGQSRWQVERNEDFDSPLTELGREQARRLGSWLANGATLDGTERVEITCLRTSPLSRARETAEILNQFLHLPITIDTNLRESDFLVSTHLPST